MKKQDYSSHKKYYPLHHFVLLPGMLFFTGLGIRNYFYEPGSQLAWLLFGISSFCTLLLAVMLRQHYALGNQNRIVRLEFRLRYLELFNKSSREAEQNLSFAQIAALRFADDAAFPNLLQRAITENLGANEIKKSITDWQADYMRV